MRARSADSRLPLTSSSRMSLLDSVPSSDGGVPSSAPNRTMDGSIRVRNASSSSCASSHKADSAVIAFHVADLCPASYVPPSTSPRTTIPLPPPPRAPR